MQNKRPKEELWAELEALGEEKVRENYERRIYGDGGDKRALVKLWLERQEAARRRARDQEALDLAKEANDIAKSNSVEIQKEIRKDRILVIVAIIIAAIAAHEEIKWLISAILD